MTYTKKHYRVVLIEPSAIISAGIQELLKPYKEFEIIAVLADCSHYTERIRNLNPNLIILNPLIIDFKYRHCVEEIFNGKEEIPLVALVYQYIEPEILKHYKAVIDIADDQGKMIRKLSQVVDSNPTTPATPENELTEREKEILISVAKGMINKEIAEQHHISIHTVITHRKNITRKTGIKSVAGLTVFAILNNLIEMQEVE